MKTTLFLLSLVLGLFSAKGNDWPQWRGPHRNGISDEQGLAAAWPKEGPKLHWKITNAGSGYGSPAVVGSRIFLLGNDGLENEFVQAFDAATGRRLWSARIGKVGNPNQQPHFPAARSTPTVFNDSLYVLGSDGDVACVSAKTGKLSWKKNLRSDFKGKPGEWAYAESPLLDGDSLVCTPGGSDATLLALNRVTGDVLWKCPLPGDEEAAYSSAIVLNEGGLREYVQLLQKGLVGVEAKTGKFLWRYSKPISKYNANIPTPVASGEFIYTASAGTGAGLARLKIKGDTVEPEQIYFESKLPTAIGGVVKVGDYLYGTTGQALMCVDFATGKVKWEERSIGTASIMYADHLLFLHGENGDVALVTASPDSYQEKGRFTPPDQPAKSQPMEKAWAHPVLANGQLYIRDHNMLWCYDVRR